MSLSTKLSELQIIEYQINQINVKMKFNNLKQTETYLVAICKTYLNIHVQNMHQVSLIYLYLLSKAFDSKLYDLEMLTAINL